MANPKISIVIPSFNKGKYIEETLKSIFSQSYDNFEVVVMDGGSEDETLQIIKKYVNKFPEKIYLESKKDEGQFSAINRGIKKTSGDIVTFINADDLYLPDAFQNVANVFSQDYYWYAGGGVIFTEKHSPILDLITWIKNFLLGINNFNILLVVNYLMQPSVFISKKAINKFGMFSGNRSFVMEYDMWLRLGRESMPFLIRENLSAFRISPGSITSNMPQKLLEEDEKVVSRFTNNQFIILMHKIINSFRKFIIQII